MLQQKGCRACVGCASQLGVKSTKQVQRDVNPMFKSTVVLMDLEQDDMLEFIVRDIGVFAVSHTGGFGPRSIARGVLRAVEDFSGHLELTPIKEVPEQGPPVLQLTTRYSTVLADPYGLGLPPLGNTSVLSSLFGSDKNPAGPSAEQAVMPSAPPFAAAEPSPEPLVEVVRLQVMPRVTEMSSGVPGSSGVRAAPTTTAATAPTAPTTPTAEAPMSSEAPHTTSGSFWGSGVPAVPTSGPEPTPTFVSSGSAQAAPTTTSSVGSSGVRGVRGSSSTFWIDEEVFLFCPKGQSMSRLEQMRDRKLLYPFPSSPCRNYNCLGAGFDRETGTWDHIWPGMPLATLGSGFDELLEQFQKFVENKKDHKEYTEVGCNVILQWLKQCQATLLAHEFIQRSSKFGVGTLPGSPRKPPPRCIINSDALYRMRAFIVAAVGGCCRVFVARVR